jgi:hypothetical protein
MITLLIVLGSIAAWLSCGTWAVYRYLPEAWAKARYRNLSNPDRVRSQVRRTAIWGVFYGPVPLVLDVFFFALDAFIDAGDPGRKEQLARRDLREAAEEHTGMLHGTGCLDGLRDGPEAWREPDL